MKRIYISGQITGLDLKMAEEYFKAAEQVITDMGHIAINPMVILPYSPELTWENYMVADIKAIFTCDAMLMLENWKNSKGAKIEHAIAQGKGIDVYYSLDSIPASFILAYRA